MVDFECTSMNRDDKKQSSDLGNFRSVKFDTSPIELAKSIPNDEPGK